MSDDVKPVVVTGANRGIGRAIVEALLDERDDTRVFLGSRSVDRGQKARSEIVADRDGVDDRIDVVELDVTDDETVDEAVETISSKLGSTPLYGLVNNAGIGDRDRDIRQVLDVNTRGPRRVAEALLPLIAHDDGRIVNVSSAAGPNFVAECNPERQQMLTDPTVTWDDIEEFIDECIAATDDGDFEATEIGNGSAYGLSKACLNAYTMDLARRNTQLLVNACTPGFIETDLTRPMAERRGEDPEDLGMKPPSEATTAPMFLLFGQPEGTGWYFGSDAKRSPLDRYRSPGDPPYTGD